MTYIWEKEIEKIEWVTVIFKDGTEQGYNEKSLWYLVTDEPKDPTELQAIIVDNVLPEIKECIVGDDITEISSKMLVVFENHDVTNYSIQKIMNQLSSRLLSEYDAFMRTVAGEKIDEYNAKIAQYQEISKNIWDSYEMWYWTAIAKAFGTHVEWQHPANGLDNIRISDLKKYLL